MKGISPLVATILLIAITVGIAGIIGVWLPSLVSSQTQTVGANAQNTATCTSTTMKIDSVYYHIGSNLVNVTTEVATGSAPSGSLQNFTIVVSGGGITNSSGVGYINSSYFNPGDVNASSITVSSGVVPPSFVRVQAYCQSSFPIIATCNSGNSCMHSV